MRACVRMFKCVSVHEYVLVSVVFLCASVVCECSVFGCMGVCMCLCVSVCVLLFQWSGLSNEFMKEQRVGVS
jgi:hypothetical protein